MNVRLFDGPIRTSPALFQRVHRRIEHALRRVAERVSDVQVWITDLNAQRGGVDKRCRIVASVAHSAPIVVDAHESDYYRAVDAAAAKLHRAAEHRLARKV